MKYVFKMVITFLSRPMWRLGRVCDRIYSCWYSVQFKACGENCQVRTCSVFYVPENITIGNNFMSLGNLYMYSSNVEILVGDNVDVSTNVQIGASE